METRRPKGAADQAPNLMFDVWAMNPPTSNYTQTRRPKGAADVVVAVLKAVGGPKATAVVFGYDWGGGIGLSMATSKRHRKHVLKVVAFHPSYTEATKDELLTLSR